jgi:rhodanese-related sulfurtransferase
MKSLWISLAITSVLLTPAGCGGGGTATTPTSTTPSTQMPGTEVKLANGSYWTITPPQLAAMNPAEYLLVNVDEAPMLIIAGTELFVKAAEIAQNLNKFPTDKNAKIVVYCIAGITSKSAAEQLVAAGYTRVMHLDGGTMKWQALGYPVQSYTAT